MTDPVPSQDWKQTAIILVVFVLAVLMVFDPVLNLIFSPSKRNIRAPYHQEKKKEKK